MWEEIEKSPVFAAPGSNDFTGVIANSTAQSIGAKAHKPQALSTEDSTALCLKYRPLAFSIARRYQDRGVELDELRSAGLFGLVLASKKFNPDRGIAFGGYAKFWIKGQILELFKPKPDALARKKPKNAKAPEDYTGPALSVETPVGEDGGTLAGLLVDHRVHVPLVAPDLSPLEEKDRQIIQGRESGETLRGIGKRLGISSERVRQTEARARSRIKRYIAVLFCDRPPPAHVYFEPAPSLQIAHHRCNATRLAGLRGNAPLRNPRGPYGGPIIHAWWRP